MKKEAEGEFVPVYDSIKTYYGGDQMWWPDDSNKENRGCGPVAAANITYYFADKDSSKYGQLYPYPDISKTNFMKHMDTLYTYVDPGILGEPSLNDWTEDVKRYALDRGVILTDVRSSASFTLENTSNYIKNGLSIDSPVACLNLQPFGYEYGAHWMTITKYYKDSMDNRYIAVSTWGERHSINYKTWFDSTYLWGGGLMYFK